MDIYEIKGGQPLIGEVEITGAKNSVLGIIAATVLTDDTIVIRNVPHIEDVHRFLLVLKRLGADVDFTDVVLTINTKNISTYDCLPFKKEIGKMRASYYLLGSLLGRFNKAIVPYPGGCPIGERPIDLHEMGFRKLGATIDSNQERVSLKTDALKGNHIYLDNASVGATINIMLAAVLADGVTIIENAAKEPHVVDIANFLNHMGAKIYGTGTYQIRIHGVDKLHGCEYTVIPDQIVTGTYMIAAAATQGDILVKNAIPKHMESLTAKLEDMGITVEQSEKGIRVKGERPFQPTKVRTHTYPGFPTDLQQLMAVLMMLSDGESLIEENVFEDRFGYIEELKKLGATARVKNNRCYITGVDEIHAGNVTATDLRAGAAMVIAALVADGVSQIDNIENIDRGYEALEENLRRLGADIKRIEQS